MPTTPMQCRHVFTDGRRCASPTLRHEPFCYYHHTTRRPVQNPAARRRRSATFTLPELDSRASIQLALSEVLQRIASNEIDPKRAGHLLYGLQIAATLLPKQDPKAQPASVAEITHDPDLGDLAPVAHIGHDEQPDELDLLLTSLNHPANEDTEPTTHNVELPTLQASTHIPSPNRRRIIVVTRTRLRWKTAHPTQTRARKPQAHHKNQHEHLH